MVPIAMSGVVTELPSPHAPHQTPPHHHHPPTNLNHSPIRTNHLNPPRRPSPPSPHPKLGRHPPLLQPRPRRRPRQRPHRSPVARLPRQRSNPTLPRRPKRPRRLRTMARQATKIPRPRALQNAQSSTTPPHQPTPPKSKPSAPPGSSAPTPSPSSKSPNPPTSPSNCDKLNPCASAQSSHGCNSQAPSYG